jgi:hypothetical protein
MYFILFFLIEENFIRIRGAMLVCLSTFRVPLRPQNWRLLVVSKELSSLEEKRVLGEHNKKHYSDKADFATGFLIRVSYFIYFVLSLNF